MQARLMNVCCCLSHKGRNRFNCMFWVTSKILYNSVFVCLCTSCLAYSSFLLDVWILLAVVFSLKRDFFVTCKVLYSCMQNSDAFMRSMPTHPNDDFEWKYHICTSLCYYQHFKTFSHFLSVSIIFSLIKFSKCLAGDLQDTIDLGLTE